ncbi:MdtA/MuxA family multidrug efflux RND transporter periplasmic adaptor subunit [Chimaeribacter arupi]|uniref:MdtA/MuxA family multidrug efflux RND transporter periplasmic adaptor subunit n=1 Tax=Chimaeribacter arupi TaxID=2060066 RepID=UPI000C7DFEE3|nr:MdtA/MuxA family multidrug efflux RND transporter periplasmic adaptor subunit [Chimaeribacter arupi]PLR48804.1 multidrug transporter subunit MdtA [Chimaeribacter arupi]
MNASQKRRIPLRRLLVWLVVLLAAFAAWHFFIAEPPADQNATNRPQGRGGRHQAAPPPVQAALATTQSVPHYLTGLGTVTAANTVTVKSRVDGELMALHFTEGQQVKAGQLLAEIDPRPYQVALTQAEGQLAKDQATLANARQDLARYQKLGKTNLISQQELDAQQSLVRESEGSVKADQGAVASARLQLDYSRITAPIDGRVGLKQVDIGNYITSGDTTGLVILTQTRPIDVVFTLPEDTIPTLLRAQQSGRPVPVEAWDRTNTVKVAEGALLSLDNQIDATTGTIKIKARFSNDDGMLFPNQFVNARVKVNTVADAVVVPAAAIQMGNDGNYVWVLDAQNQVSKHIVTLGTQDSHQVVIAAGLSAGARVVTDGLDRLKEGLKVEVLSNDEAAPHAAAPADAAPTGRRHPRDPAAAGGHS